MSLKNPNPRDSVRPRDGVNVKHVFDGPEYRLKGNRRRIVVGVLVICAMVATLVAADYWMHYGRIYPGVEAGNIALGGKTPEEAQQILEKHSTDTLKEIRFTSEPKEVALTSEELGINLDAQASADQAYGVGRRGNILNRLYERIKATWGTLRVPLVVDYDREQLRDHLRNGLSDLFARLTVEPVEAGFRVDGNEVSVTKSQTGQKVDEEKLLGEIEAGLPEGTYDYEVPVVDDEAKLTTEEAEKLKPTTLLGSYRTNYTLSSDKSPERVENLKIASNAITGRSLAPGEVFSMNEVVSPLDYNKTSVIIGGKEDKADGGGLCQVTSTLYDAANYADLEIVERHSHDAQLPYIRPGMDATVWFGSLDMKFKNNTDSYILLREYVANDGYIYAEIYGQPTGKKVEMNSESTYLGSDSSEWVTYKKVTDKDGKVLYDDVFHTDTYKPLVDEHGYIIPPPEVPVAPVNP